MADFVNRGVQFDGLYVYPPLLDACTRIIGRRFKLSSLQARNLHARSDAQELHVDVARDSAGWPLGGFILMLDQFRADNGATRFVPGSHRWASAPEDEAVDVRADRADQVLACGQRGHCWSSTARPGTATRRTGRMRHDDRCRARSSRTTGGRRPTSQGACPRRRVHVCHRWRVMSLASESGRTCA